MLICTRFVHAVRVCIVTRCFKMFHFNSVSPLHDVSSDFLLFFLLRNVGCRVALNYLCKGGPQGTKIFFSLKDCP